MTKTKTQIDYAVVYVALKYFGMTPKTRIANYSDYDVLPPDVKNLCHGNLGFAGSERMAQHLFDHYE